MVETDDLHGDQGARIDGNLNVNVGRIPNIFDDMSQKLATYFGG